MADIIVQDPVVVPAIPERVYDKLRLISLHVDASDPIKVSLTAKLQKYCLDENQAVLLSPEPETITHVDDLYKTLNGDPEKLSVIDSVVKSVVEIAAAQGKVKPVQS